MTINFKILYELGVNMLYSYVAKKRILFSKKLSYDLTYYFKDTCHSFNNIGTIHNTTNNYFLSL